MNIMLCPDVANSDYVFYSLKERIHTFYENIPTITEIPLGKKCD